VVGEGAWETHPTGSLPSARQMGGLLHEKGIPHELDVWGHDSAHDWDWWQKQLAHHLPRFV
jgi:esterase/lipase superfamily enzyme